MELRDDTLRGAKAIADFIGESERRTFYLLEKRQLVAFKRGEIWHSRKSTILRDIEAKEAASVEPEVA